MKSVVRFTLGAIWMAGSNCQAGDPLPEPLKIGVSMRNDAERLTCFDHAVASIEAGNEPSCFKKLLEFRSGR